MAGALHGQDAPDSSLLATEIQGIEKKLGDAALSGAGRRENLITLGRLLTLAGNIEGAAQSWTEAAFAEPGKRDDRSLLAGARCLAALGEFDQAEAYLKTILLTGASRPILAAARYLAAQIEAFRSGDPGALAPLTDHPDYADLNPALLYTLWRVSGADTYKTQLLADYPASPEARILGGSVDPPPLALWLLFPGREDPGSALAAQAPASAAIAAPLPAAPAPADAPAAAPAKATAAAADAAPVKAAVLQTGLFSREENAKAMAERLTAAGFSAAVNPRRVNEGDYWAVSVPPGADMQQTILRLKDAGFESFPVF
jgi:tetratricopeptide (TPR) repeat protein